MSIESTNIYDLLSAENEGGVLPAKPTAKDSKVETKATVAKQSKEAEKKPAELGKGRKNEDKPKRTPGKTGGGGDRPPREKPANPNKRVFDRRSGTGRGKGDQKKGGAGKGNWGSIEPSEELAAEVQPIEEAAKEPVETEEKPETPEATTVPTEAPTQEKPAEEEEDKTLSYEEWKAKNEVKTVDLPVPIRQAGEGVDDSAWAEYVPLSREPEGEVGKSAEKTSEKKKKDSSSGKLRVDEVFKIQTEEKKGFRGKPLGNKRPPGPRGDNKNFRGGRGRPNNKNFSLNEEAFPSLTTKA